MVVKEIFNVDDIKSILLNNEIYDTITDDSSVSALNYEPPIEDHLYVGGYVGGEIMALMIYHKYLDGNECHVHVLPEFRKEYAKEFGGRSLIFRGVKPLYAEIPDLYKNVLNFALMNSFEVIDKKLGDFVKNGVEYPVNILRYNDGVS